MNTNMEKKVALVTGASVIEEEAKRLFARFAVDGALAQTVVRGDSNPEALRAPVGRQPRRSQW
ncbi:MAG: hypothetical protein EPO25_01615 [Gammaproteobacteria bacterium]|nr:MAG: hypothetical protein EPO25_01615 [Gammaproteobacteria bacterium]